METYKDYLNQVLDDLKKKNNISTDAELARHLGLNQSSITRFRSGERLMNDWLLIKLAHETGRPTSKTLQVILTKKPMRQEIREAIAEAIKLIRK